MSLRLMVEPLAELWAKVKLLLPRSMAEPLAEVLVK
jgi:hypothetical protein